MDLAVQFNQDGYAIARDLLDGATIDQLRQECEPIFVTHSSHRAVPGVRHILGRIPSLRTVLDSPPLIALRTSLGAPTARPVRSILFDKSPAANWLVPWHQDATIALRDRVEHEGFGPWSIKDGEHHCRPPRFLLDRLFALRLHLDDNGSDTGPLRVIPGSHTIGLVPERELPVVVSSTPYVECRVQAGDAVVMRPHVVHSSAKSTSTARRRVLHIEYCDAELPKGLHWATP